MKTAMKCSFGPSTLQQLNVIFIWQAGTISTVFQTVLAVQEVRFFSSRFLIVTYKKIFLQKTAGWVSNNKAIFVLKNQTWVS